MGTLPLRRQEAISRSGLKCHSLTRNRTPIRLRMFGRMDLGCVGGGVSRILENYDTAVFLVRKKWL
jgi:hypothetical protein